MPWISNPKHMIEEKSVKNRKCPVLLQSCRPWTGGPVGISNIDFHGEVRIPKCTSSGNWLKKIGSTDCQFLLIWQPVNTIMLFINITRVCQKCIIMRPCNWSVKILEVWFVKYGRVVEICLVLLCHHECILSYCSVIDVRWGIHELQCLCFSQQESYIQERFIVAGMRKWIWIDCYTV